MGGAAGKHQGFVLREYLSAAIVVALLAPAIVFVGVLYSQFSVWATAIAVFVCCVPPVFAFIAYRIIDLRNICSRIQIATKDDQRGARLLAIWRYESERATTCKQSALAYVLMWGGSVGLTLAAGLTLPCLMSDNAHYLVCEHFAAALLASTSVCFLVGLGRILVRVANEDASKRMFAVAFQLSIVSIVTTVVLFFLAKQLSVDFLADDKASVVTFIGAGAGVALLGPGLLDDLLGRLGALIGLKPKPKNDVTPLSSIEGLTSEEMARLHEEGIVSIEALAYNPIPRLFFNTGFSIERICDWHDKALLITHVGVESARRLRGHFGIRGAWQLKQRGATKIAELGRAFEGASTEQVQAILDSVASNAFVDEVQAFREATLYMDDDAEDTAPRAVISGPRSLPSDKSAAA